MRCPNFKDFPAAPSGKIMWPWTEAPPPLPRCIPGGSSWPRVSIVTPSYNQSQFLEEAIRSVLLQGYPDLEYIIIDGGSTDGSVDVIKKYEPWLAFWVSEKDHGQSHAINKGFDRCTGDIITFTGSDDIYLPGTFAHVASKWSELKNYGAIVGSFVYMDEFSRIYSEPRPPLLPHEGPIDLTLGPPGIYRLHQVSTFYMREALDAVGKWVREDLQYTMDRELLYRICRSHKVYLTDQVYGAFRVHPDSKSGSEVLAFSEEFSKLYLIHLNQNKKDNNKRKKMARYHKARGLIKYARKSNRKTASAVSLAKALFNYPSFVFRYAYISAWLGLLGLR